MKTNRASINIKLRKEVVKADGTHPIVLRVSWQGKRADMTLAVTCRKNDWNDKKQCLKATSQSAYLLNGVISRIRHEAEDARDELIKNNKPYTAADIIVRVREQQACVKKQRSVKLVLKELKKEDLWKSPNTTKCYIKAVRAFLKCFGREDMSITEVSEQTVGKFVDWLKSNDQILSSNTCKEYMEKMSRVASFAVEKGYLGENPFCLPHMGKVFPRVYNNQALNEFQRNLLIKYFETRCRDMWYETMARKLCRPFSKEFALWFYLCGCIMQGLAPIDLALLTWDNLTRETSEMWTMKLRRRKTGQPVVLAVWKNVRNVSLLRPCLERRKQGRKLLFPIMDGVDTADAVAVERRENAVIGGMASALKKVWREFNEWIIEKASEGFEVCLFNADGTVRERKQVTRDNAVDILVDEHFTMYSYRHTFATIFMENGGTAYDLARLLGRTVASIDEYLALLPFNTERRSMRMFQLMG